jgi:hypothetical protein
VGVPRDRKLLRRARRDARSRTLLPRGRGPRSRRQSVRRVERRVLDRELRARSARHRLDDPDQSPALRRARRGPRGLPRHRTVLPSGRLGPHDDAGADRGGQPVARTAHLAQHVGGGTNQEGRDGCASRSQPECRRRRDRAGTPEDRQGIDGPCREARPARRHDARAREGVHPRRAAARGARARGGVRQPRQHARGARGGSAARDGDPRVDRRRASPARTATPHGNDALRHGRRRRGISDGRRGVARARGLAPAGGAAGAIRRPAGRPRLPVCLRRVGARGHALRHRTGAGPSATRSSRCRSRCA